MIESSNIQLKVNGVTDPISVLDYNYMSEISKPYSCEISFASSNPNLDSSSFMYQESTLDVSFDDGGSTNNIYGIITEFYQLDEIGDLYEYKIVIEPEIVKLKNQKATNVFLNKSIDEIVKECFKKVGFKNYKIQLSNPTSQVVGGDKYPKREFVFQYQETYFDFISRWLEYEGIYYYFDAENSENGGKKNNILILTDQSNSAQAISHNDEGVLAYDKNALISNNTPTTNYVMSFFAYTSRVPKMLTLNGYDYENDSQNLSMTKEISKTGLGDVTIFDENAIDNDSIKRILNVRSQGMACMEHVFMGSTNLSNIRVGRHFKLTDHFRKDYNGSYFITEVSQTFSQRSLFLSKYSNENERDNDIQLVSTDFKAIPLKTQYRPQLLTPVKKIDGVIPAIVDSEVDDDTPYLDDKGRYKVKFLHTDDQPGKGSGWIRKLESFLGNKYGTSMPLHKDVEVSIGFEYGNPDKPIIVGAVQNSSHENPITNDNPDQGYAFKSAQGNYVEFSDEEDKEYVKIYSPFGNSFYTVGYTDLDKYWSSDFGWIWSPMPEGSPDPEEVANLDYSDKAGVTIAGSNYEQILGDSFSVIHGDSYTATMGKFDIDLHLGAGMNEFNLVGEKADVTLAGVTLDSTTVLGIAFETNYATKKFVIDRTALTTTEILEVPDYIRKYEGKHYETVEKDYFELVGGDYTISVDQTAGIKAKQIGLFTKGNESNSSITMSGNGLFLNFGENSISIDKNKIELSAGGASIILGIDGVSLSYGTSRIQLEDEIINLTKMDNVTNILVKKQNELRIRKNLAMFEAGVEERAAAARAFIEAETGVVDSEDKEEISRSKSFST